MRIMNFRIVIVLLTAVVILGGCCKLPYRRLTYKHYVSNSTDKRFIHIQYINRNRYVDIDSLFFYVDKRCKDSLEWTVSAIVGNTQKFADGLNYKEFYIYNLTDTTFLKWDDIMKGYKIVEPNSPPNFKFEIVDRDVWTDKNEVSTIFRCNLDITDEFLKLFKKDYTMLDKFKDYYK